MASGCICESEKEREEQSVLFLIDEQLLGRTVRTVLKAERQRETIWCLTVSERGREREREREKERKRERDAHTQRELVV